MTNDNNSELIIVEGTAVAPYGHPDEVREITDRLMALHPSARDVGMSGMRAVAQLAIMSGANPLPSTGEIYVWPGRDGKPVVDFGIAYYRRIANQNDTIIWMERYEPRKMSKSEREDHGVDDDALASICKGFCLSEYMNLVNAGVPWQAAQSMLARTSTAVVSHDEMFYARDTKYRKKGTAIDPPKGRTWQWVCNKRAEKGWYRVKSLVDTTMTDNMKARAQRVMAELADETPLSDMFAEEMTVEETNELLFADQGHSEYDQPDPRGTQSPAAQAEREPSWMQSGNGDIADLRSKLDENKRISLSELAYMIADTGLYAHVNHAMNTILKYDFPDGFEPSREAVIKSENAVKIFDWAVTRKETDE